MKLLQLEFFKLRRKRLFITVPVFLAAEMLWGFMATSMGIAKHPDSAVWESIITTITSMNGLFLPILAAIVVSRICDMEHKGNTWWLLVSNNVSKTRVYFYKFLTANLVMFYVSVIQTVTIICFGIIHKFSDPIPLLMLVKLLVATTIANLIVIAIQQLVSMLIKNQSFALCLGMVGGFIGMTSGLFPVVVRRLFIWSYYSELAPVSMLFKSETLSYQYNSPFKLSIGVLIATFMIYIAGSKIMKNKDI